MPLHGSDCDMLLIYFEVQGLSEKYALCDSI